MKKSFFSDKITDLHLVNFLVMATANKGMEPGLGLDNLTVLSSLFSRDLVDSLGSGLHGLF